MAKAMARGKRSCGIAKIGSPRAELTKEDGIFSVDMEDGGFSVDMEDLTFDAPECAGLALEAALEAASVEEASAGLALEAALEAATVEEASALEAALEAASVEEASGGEGGGEKG